MKGKREGGRERRQEKTTQHGKPYAFFVVVWSQQLKIQMLVVFLGLQIIRSYLNYENAAS